MPLTEIVKSLDPLPYLGTKLFDKIGETVRAASERHNQEEFALSSAEVDVLKNGIQMDNEEDKTQVIRAGGTVLREYYRSKNIFDPLVRQQLIVLAADGKLDTWKIAERIFSQFPDERIYSSGKDLSGWIKLGIKLLLDTMIDSIEKSPEYVSITLQIDQARREIIKSQRESIEKQDAKAEAIKSRLEYIIQLIGPDAFDPDKNHLSTLNVQSAGPFYKEVVKVVKGDYNMSDTFLKKRYGERSILKTYIESKYCLDNGERDDLNNWISQIWNGESPEYVRVHFITGNKGMGKSLFCLMSVYRFLEAKGRGEPTDYDNVLLFTLSKTWYSDTLHNNIIGTNADVDKILETIEKIPDVCQSIRSENTMIFIDGYDDMHASNPYVSLDKIQNILANKIRRMSTFQNIHVFITARENDGIDPDDPDRAETSAEISGFSREDREQWYNKKYNDTTDKDKESLKKYWENDFSRYEEKNHGLIGNPLLFSLIVNYQIKNASTPVRTYKYIAETIFENDREDASWIIHEKLAFETFLNQEDLCRFSYSKGFSEDVDSYFEGGGISFFVQKKSDGSFEFDSVFKDFFLVKYFSRRFDKINKRRRNTNQEVKAVEDSKEVLSDLAYWKIDTDHIKMFNDLTKDNKNIDWPLIINTMLERLAVINNPDFMDINGVIDQEHTDDGQHNYSMREYCNIFCNTISFVSIRKESITLKEENRARFAYLLELFDCSGIYLCPCGTEGITARRALLSKAHINGTYKRWDLEGTDFSGAHFIGAEFTDQSILTKCDFYRSEFINVNFTENTDLSWNFFDSCKFTNVHFDDPDGVSPKMEGVTFRNCIFKDVTFGNYIFKDVTFGNCNFAHVTFEHCSFETTTFSDAVGLNASAFTKECKIIRGSQIFIEVQGRETIETDTFNSFDTERKSRKKSCVLTISIDEESIRESVKDFCEKNGILEEGGFDRKRALYQITDSMGELDDGMTILISAEIEENVRMLGLTAGRICNNELPGFSNTFFKCLELLKEGLSVNNIGDIHVFYRGPVFIPFYLGRILGNDFNIHIYQYDMQERQYHKVGVSAG